MGQGSSAETGFNAGEQGGSASSSVKTCYYELLAVPRDATQDEIKKAYKRKALELHPDRNYDDVERATRLFTEIQGAYEVLSDPQERAWYDSHREAILRNDHHSVGGRNAQPRAANVTTSEDIMEWFSIFASRLSYDDSNSESFYTVLGKAFKKLAEEEVAAAELVNEDVVYYPDFGNSKSTHKDHVKNFYTVWGNFRTAKTFSWYDIYRYSDAPDRRIKRIIEKENKRLRDAAIREFNDTVRSFIMFVRKRDPRFIPNTQTKAQRQAALLAASKEQAARQRAENAAKLRNYKAADWTRAPGETVNARYDSEEPEGENRSGANGAKKEEEEEEEEEEEIERYECIVCKKTFGSEGQMNAHERSKKHSKAVQALERQMQKENEEFDLNRDVRGWEKKVDEFTPIDNDKEGGLNIDEKVEELEAEKKPVTIDKLSPNTLTFSPSPSPVPSDIEDSSEYTTQQQFEVRILGNSPPTSAPSPSSLSATEDLTEDLTESLSNTNLNSDSEKPQASKVGKAKAKRAKKAAQPTTAETGELGANVCVTCKESFPSSTKMFNHLRDNPSHTKPVPSAAGGNRGKGKGKGKGKRK